MSGKAETVLADAAGIARAAGILRAGGLVALPTETVYGLAARADSAEAVARIYRAKGRPCFNPLIVHVAGLEEAERLAHFSTAARAVAQAAWPGPLTLVLPRREGSALAAAVTAGLPTVALRAPAHPVMQAVLAACAVALAAPSANRSTQVSPTSAAHVEQALGGAVDLILDGGPCERGIESTILAVRENGAWEMLRPGPVDADALHRRLRGSPLPPPPRRLVTVEAPGQLALHYSPGKPVRLAAQAPEPGEYMIGFGDITGDCTLSAGGNLVEAAAQLYACLHRAAASKSPRIAIAPVPDGEIGAAINDRLRRAASSDR